MARKATVKNYYVRNLVPGSLSDLVNARQEISRGNREYGVHWKFEEVDSVEFMELLESDGKDDSNSIFCIETLSGKFYEVDKEDIENKIFNF